MMVFKNIKSVICLLVYLMLWAGAAQAIEVKLDNGETISATQVEWDGTQFTITAGMKTKVPAERVKYLKMDENILDVLRERASGLERDKTSLEEEADALGRKAQREEMRAQKAEATAAKLRKQVEEYDMVAATVTKFKNDEVELRRSIKEQMETITKLRKSLEAEKKKFAAATKNLARESSFKMVGTLSYTASSIPGLIDTQGRIRNTSAQDVNLVVLEISALDKKGKLLAMSTAYIINFKANSTRPFITDLEVDHSKVATMEVDVADVVIKVRP